MSRRILKPGTPTTTSYLEDGEDEGEDWDEDEDKTHKRYRRKGVTAVVCLTGELRSAKWEVNQGSL